MKITSSSSLSLNLANLSENPIGTFAVSPEETIALINKLSSDFSFSVINFLQGGSGFINGFLERMHKIRSIYNSFLISSSKTARPVSVDLLEENSGSANSLRDLFNGAFPRIANSAADSEEILKQLKEVGIEISATVKIPIYIKTFDAKDKLISEEIAYVDDAQRNYLSENYEQKNSEIYEGAAEIKIGLAENSYQIATLFNQQLNYAVQLEQLSTSSFQLKVALESLLSDFSKKINFISGSLEKLSEIEEIVRKSNKTNSTEIQDIALKKINNFISELESMRFLLKERRLREKLKMSDNSNTNENLLFDLINSQSASDIYKVIPANNISDLLPGEPNTIFKNNNNKN